MSLETQLKAEHIARRARFAAAAVLDAGPKPRRIAYMKRSRWAPAPLPPAPPSSKRDMIVHDVASRHGVTFAEIMKGSRLMPVIIARQECFYLMRESISAMGRPISFPQIGRYFGLDHTTVIHGYNRHAERMGARHAA